MGRGIRSFAWLGTAIWLAGCEPAVSVDATNTQAEVLEGTESSKEFGDYVLYFNALNTDQLTPDIASEYGIVRSKSRAMLNVSIHRPGEGSQTGAVTGTVTASAVNLNGQLKTMTLREVREEQAIYYIGELPITDAEVLIFTVNATPTGGTVPFTVRFKKQFFVEE